MIPSRTPFPPLGRCALLVGLLVLGACGGTKVYEVNKTVVYDGTLYNITDVKQVRSHVEAVVDGREAPLDLKNADRRAFNGHLEQYGALPVRMYFSFDEEEMLYRSATVDSWRQFSSMQRDFESAQDRVMDLMKSRKSTQIELR